MNVFGGADGAGRGLARRRARGPDGQGAPLRQGAAAREEARARDRRRDRRRRRRRARLARRRRARDARRGRRGGRPMSAPLVAVVMGSASDLPVMSPAADVLAEFGVACEAPRRLGAPHARPPAALRPRGQGARAARAHRGRGRCGAPAGHARVGDVAAGDRRPRRARATRRARLAALHRPDAARACRSPPSRSTARPTPRSSPCGSSRSTTPPLAAALDRHREGLAEEAHRQDRGLGAAR